MNPLPTMSAPMLYYHIEAEYSLVGGGGGWLLRKGTTSFRHTIALEGFQRLCVSQYGLGFGGSCLGV